jgi:hypothetical protein
MNTTSVVTFTAVHNRVHRLKCAHKPLTHANHIRTRMNDHDAMGWACARVCKQAVRAKTEAVRSAGNMGGSCAAHLYWLISTAHVYANGQDEACTRARALSNDDDYTYYMITM